MGDSEFSLPTCMRCQKFKKKVKMPESSSRLQFTDAVFSSSVTTPFQTAGNVLWAASSAHFLIPSRIGSSPEGTIPSPLPHSPPATVSD